MPQQYSPNMLKTYELCPRKFYYRYLKNISMPTNDDIFEFGKNIHALAAYYLNKNNVDLMEKSLTPKETETWNYLKSIKYFSYEFVEAEYNLAHKINNKFFGGRLDALVKNEDTYYILDYKTGAIPKNPKYDFQTMIYSLCVSELYKTNNVVFVYIDLKSKSDVQVKLSEDLKHEYIKKLEDVVEKIETNDFLLNKKKKDCVCEYSIMCY